MLEKRVTLSGRWRIGMEICQVDNHTRLDCDVRDADLDNSVLGAVFSSEDKTKLTLVVTRVGMHCLYFAVAGKFIFWDESEWSLISRVKKLIGKEPKITQVGSGDIYEFDGSRVELVDVLRKDGATTVDTGLEDAIDQLEEMLPTVVGELLETTHNEKVVCMLSGGADSTSTLVALKLAGVDVHAVCVGRSEDDFDPSNAREYAKQLGVQYTFIPLPDNDTDLKKLLTRAIRVTEQCEMSNTMMAMCTTLIRDWALENDRKIIFHGYYADSVLGFSNITFGQFKKAHPEQTDQQWTDYRSDLYQHMIPNNTQVAKVSRAYGCEWRAIYYHPTVRRFIWSMPQTVTPAEGKKPLLWGLCDRYIKGAAWHSKPKIGYYTGSGIGKIRLENPILQDKYIRNVFKLVRKERKNK